jgi:dolichyl-phosphate beta-glucosyltransferase
MAPQPWSHPHHLFWSFYSFLTETPFYILGLISLALAASGILAIYILLHILAPKPRPVLPSEKTYITTNPDGTVSSPRPLPCWYDRWLAERHLSESTKPTPGIDVPDGFPVPADVGAIEPAEVAVSVVIPAYNEADRILPTVEEMVDYLDDRFGRPNAMPKEKKPGSRPSTPHHRLVFRSNAPTTGEQRAGSKVAGGYEIIVVNDGSTDRTVEVALDFARKRGLHDVLRVVTLERNRGKGGCVTHGFRHVRGEYVVFADADGASRFADLGRLIEGCEDVVDGSNRGVAIGSRAHLVGSEAVVKVCFSFFLSFSLPRVYAIL